MINTFWKKTGSGQKAFTLVELLMAMSIFVIFLTIAGNSFLSIVRAQTAANQVREMYSELRTVVDFLNDDMHNGTIDFGCYQHTAVNCPTEFATNGTMDGTTLIIATNDGLKKNRYQLKEKELIRSVAVKNGENWQVENSEQELFKNLEVNKAAFQIYPKQDPAKDRKNLATQIQPMVFVDLEVKSANPSVNFELNFHTLITSRQYK